MELRRVVAAFDGRTVSSDAGALLLGKSDAAIGLIDRLAGCFVDGCDPKLIEYAVRTLIERPCIEVLDHQSFATPACEPAQALAK